MSQDAVHPSSRAIVSLLGCLLIVGVLGSACGEDRVHTADDAGADMGADGSSVDECTLTNGECIAPAGRVCCPIRGALYNEAESCLEPEGVVDCFAAASQFDCGVCTAVSCYETKPAATYLHSKCWPSAYVQGKGIHECANDKSLELQMLPECP